MTADSDSRRTTAAAVECGGAYAASSPTTKDREHRCTLTLPTRFKMLWLSHAANHHGHNARAHVESDGDVKSVGSARDNGINEVPCREEDVNNAIRWLRQQIVSFIEEGGSRRFRHLRSLSDGARV